jgi:hypothetical protein
VKDKDRESIEDAPSGDLFAESSGSLGESLGTSGLQKPRKPRKPNPEANTLNAKTARILGRQLATNAPRPQDVDYDDLTALAEQYGIPERALLVNLNSLEGIKEKLGSLGFAKRDVIRAQKQVDHMNTQINLRIEALTELEEASEYEPEALEVIDMIKGQMEELKVKMDKARNDLIRAVATYREVEAHPETAIQPLPEGVSAIKQKIAQARRRQDIRNLESDERKNARELKALQQQLYSTAMQMVNETFTPALEQAKEKRDPYDPAVLSAWGMTVEQAKDLLEGPEPQGLQRAQRLARDSTKRRLQEALGFGIERQGRDVRAAAGGLERAGDETFSALSDYDITNKDHLIGLQKRVIKGDFSPALVIGYIKKMREQNGGNGD